jgi:RHS repeat-associated protein
MVGGNPNLANPAETDMQYSGEQFDVELQQQYLRARFYDQNTGRFNALDPFAGNNYDPQSLHKYAYTHCDPVNGIDPSGELVFIEILIAISFAVIVATPIIIGIVKNSGVTATVTFETDKRTNEFSIQLQSVEQFIETLENFKFNREKISYFKFTGHGLKGDLFIGEHGIILYSGGIDSSVRTFFDSDTFDLKNPRARALIKETYSEYALIELNACESAYPNNNKGAAHGFKSILPKSNVWGYTGKITPPFGPGRHWFTGTTWVEVNQ